jgi:hypothetical protein
MNIHSTSAPGRDKICAQPENSKNIPQRGLPGVKFPVSMLEGAFTHLDHESARK